MRKRKARRKELTKDERKKIEAYLRKPGNVTVCPTVYADGAHHGPTAKTRKQKRQEPPG